jgi:hypothetical protein
MKNIILRYKLIMYSLVLVMPVIISLTACNGGGGGY